MWKQLIEYLSRPFPMIDHQEMRWKMSIYFGLFVFIFLYIFRPFKIDSENSNILLVSLGFGLITMFVMVFNHYVIPLLIPKFYNSESWNIWKNFLLNFWFILSIGIGNYFFDYYFIPNDTPEYNLLHYIGITMAVGIFPSIIAMFYFEKKFKKEHDDIVKDVNYTINERRSYKKEKEIVFEGSGVDEYLKIFPTHLVMVKSDGNYSDFYYLKSTNLAKKTLRLPIKNVEESLKNEGKIMRIHRSFIVNLSHISHISGNARSLTIHFEKYDLEAPVSRSYEREVTNAIRHI